MSTHARATTVLFSDIVGSSKLYQKLGNTKAEEKIHFTIQTLAACAHHYSGKVIKTIGDEIMCSFAELSDAADAAAEMNRLVQDTKVELRTGISSGELIQRGDDLFGDVVNNAAFLTKVARAREILIDEMALDNASSFPSSKIELIAEMTMKGSSSACKIYRLNWENKLSQSMGATIINNVLTTSSTRDKLLVLTHKDQTFAIDAEHPVFVVGRDKTAASLKISHAKISRRHCSVIYKQGKFVLEDHSTNGTFVEQTGAEITSVHREAFALIGSGYLHLGQVDAEPNCVVHYEIK